MGGGMRESGDMMGGLWGMGGGLLAMYGTLLLLAVAAVAIVLLLRRTVAGDPGERIRVGALRRLDVPVATPLRPDAAVPEGEIEGFVVIPDISGYTEFMRMSALALAHAQYAVSALLSSVIEAAEPVLATAKIEGDAVFLCGVHAGPAGRRTVSGEQAGAAVHALLHAFYRKRAELIRANTCPCEACRNVARLELKTVVHSGSLYLYDLRGHREIGGLPVIVAHRLLKSDIGLARYVLVSDAANERLALPLEAAARRHAQSYDGIGVVESTIYEFTVDSLLKHEPPAAAGVPAKATDAARKLVEGLRGLRGTAGSA